MRRILFLTLIALLVYAWAASASKAATFRLEDGEVCDFSLNGRIETGDALAFERFLSNAGYTPYGYDGPDRQTDSPPWMYEPRLCLNSPGGSLEGAAEIATIVHSGYATRIRAGEQCLSACAWIFMLGRTHGGDDLFITNRSMSAYATLGFHSLSFEIPEGEYSNQVLARAIDATNTAFSIILDLAMGETPRNSQFNSPIIRNDLIQLAMSTPHTDFFYIDEVGKALIWDIPVFDIINFDASRTLTPAAEIAACDNAHSSVNYFTEGGRDYWERNSNTNAQSFDREVDTERFTLSVSGRNLVQCEGERIVSSLRACVSGSDRQDDGCIGSVLAIFPFSTQLRDIGRGAAQGARLYTELTTTVAPQPPATTCHLEGSQARITNVNQYTNLRSGAGITQPIVTRVPLNAMVTQSSPGYYYATQRCLQICQSGDQPQIAQCVENNEVWIAVQYMSRRGYLSRQFLEAP